jgi:hypothetical protein
MKKNINKNPKEKKIRGRKPKGYVLKLMLAGYSNEEIIELLQEEYEYTKHYAECLVSNCKLMVDNKLAEIAEAIAQKNVNRLEVIIDEAMIANDNKTALAAIEIENKMFNLYQMKLEVSNNENNTFKITIDE